MDIKGQAIRHKTFGSGVITASASDTITVKFSVGEKKFVYPEVFKEYLVFQNQKLQQSITALIAEKQALAERQSQMEQMERERQRKLRSFTVTPNSHAVFDVPPEQAAQVCASFTVSTGRYLSGYSKGKPRLAERLKPNSACLLTERPSGESEQARKIIGAFMVREDYFGEDSDTGMIEGHPEYRMIVPAGDTLLFWEFFSRDAAARWGSIPFRYCSAATMNQILAEMADMLADTDQRESALAFYRYFCITNHLQPLREIGAKETTPR